MCKSDCNWNNKDKILYVRKGWHTNIVYMYRVFHSNKVKKENIENLKSESKNKSWHRFFSNV